MTKKKPKKKPAKKKPLTTMRWACVYEVNGEEFFGILLAHTRRDLKGMPADRVARVRVTEIGK